jgi:hypothetical protein
VQVFLGLGRLVLNLPFKLLVIFTTIGLVIGGIWGTLNLDQANQDYFSKTFLNPHKNGLFVAPM